MPLATLLLYGVIVLFVVGSLELKPNLPYTLLIIYYACVSGVGVGPLTPAGVG